MKKLYPISMHALNGNGGIAEKKTRKNFDYKSFPYLCLKKGRKLFVSVIVLQFVMVQLMGQTITRYTTGITHERPDSANMDAALLPSRYQEFTKSRNVDTTRGFSVPAAVSSATSLNSAFAVGTTAGIADITATGGASYQIPIEVPEGVAGLKPSVAVNYNSQSGYGVMGYGWNLAASSSITRCGKTYYFDNAAEAPLLSNTDNLMLDGQRLMLISGSNLTSSAKYRLEYDPFTDITFKTVGSYQGFLVRTKDGNSREYGSTANSNIETSSGGVLLWLLSKVTDKSGNTITYEYEKITGNGEFYLKKIQFAGTRSVQFGYETRNDKQKTYFAGAVVNNNKILKTISTYIGQTLIKRYDFNYVFDGLYSKLTEIIENGQNGERFNSTQVGYGYPESGDEYFSFLSPNRQGNTPLFADFNGDGKTDFLSYPNKSSYTTSDSATLFLAYTYYGDVSFYKKCAIPMQFSGSVFQSFLLADLNGDGKMDVVNISKAANGTYRYNYYLFDGERFTYNYVGFNTNGNEALVGDFNGDGKQEILVISNKKVFNGSGSEIASGGIDDWGSVYVKDYFPNNRYLCDFNGNGKTNILVMNASGAWVYELSGSTFVRLTSFNTTDIKNYYFPYFGDFNGDGKTDVLIQNNNNLNDVSILFSTGKGFVKQSISNADIKAKVFIGDFNRDGKSDIFHMENVSGSMWMKVGIFNGTNFTTTYYSTFLTPSDFNVSYEYDKFLFQVADFDGDGRSEFCCARYVDCYIIHTFPNNQNLLAKNIIDGLGAQTSFEYAPITDAGVCANTGNSVSFPLSGHLFPLYVVQSMSQSAGSYYDYVYYRYKKPRIHVQGKGFLGFGEIECDYYYKDRKKVTQYGYNSSYYYPYITEQKVSTRSGTNLSLSVYENSSVYQGNKRVTPYIRKQTNTDYLTNTVTTVECKEIDNLGSPLKVETGYGSDVSQTVTYSYFNNGTDNIWIYGLPLSIEKKTTRGGENWIEKQTFAYNNRYLPETVISYTNDGTKKVSEETFLYDAFGNVITQSSKAFSSTNVLITGYGYSSDGVYRTSITDPLSLVTTINYNTSGLVQSVTDPRNHNTTYQYDGMGRLTATYYPDGASSSVALAWGGSAAYSIYYVTEQATGKPVVKTCFDALNRELRNSMVRYDGSEIHRERMFDNAGRLQKESLPFKGSSASQWNTYTYDSYGRIASDTKASGNTTSYTYSGRNVTVTENGIASTRCYDVQGNLTSAIDPAGTITYNLRPDGQPSSIVAPGNIVTSFHYDIYGRQDSINDPSAGKRSFGYDADGNPNRETDALGRVKSMTYDTYNRLSSKVLPEFTTTYSYDNYGQLIADKSTGGVLHHYTYDAYGRLLQYKDSVPGGKWMTADYAYSNGNVSSIQYAAQSGAIGTEHHTYANGHLSEIKLGSSSIWKLNGENNFGQPVSVPTGPLTRTYGYDGYGIHNGRSTYHSSAGIIQDYTYGFDPAKGNLTFRKDNMKNIQENFTYDNLNRLKTFAGGNIEYDVKGNITQKSDAATALVYATPGKPYAVSGINVGTNTAVPLRNQSVAYTSFERPSTISENGYTASFTYNAGRDRVRMQLVNGSGNVLLTRYYLGGVYEIDSMPSGTKERLHLGGDAYSAPAVYVKQNGSWGLYYICRDYLGSITHVANSGGVVQELSYDAWGRLRNPANQAVYAPDSEPELFLGRGYGGHEHLTQFGLINMNARLYYPVLGRFLSPDPYIQVPDFSQNFNRYSYCLNNPLRYNDPTGEWFGIDDLLIAGIGFVIGNLGHGISTGDWGWSAVAAGGMGAAMSWLGYNTAGMASGAISNATWNQVGGMAINAFTNQIMPAMYIPIGDHFGLSLSPSFGLGTDGLTSGMNFGAVYTNDDIRLAAGFGAGDNYHGWTASATYKGVGAGYGQTYYGNATGPDGQSNAQRVANVTALWRGGSFTLQNDMKKLGGDGDRWRTNAWELAFGNFSIGSYIYTNDGEGASKNAVDFEARSPIWGKNRGEKYGAWTSGETFSAPVWIGYRQGNQINRVGYSFNAAQDFQQNGVHKYIGRQQYYLGYNNFKSGFYSYSGYRNLLSLWGY